MKTKSLNNYFSYMLSQSAVLYEDNHLIAVHKPAGMLTQKDNTGDTCILDEVKAFLKIKYNKPGEAFIGCIHRLDRPVSGIILLAKTSKALERMNDQFREKQTQKRYLAIVKNQPPKTEDTLVHYLLKNTTKNISKVHENEIPHSKRAELDYKIMAKSDQFYLLEIILKTGRHHQIRAQLSAIGCPIRGDLKYGFPRSNEDGSISLHAYNLSFTHPVNKDLMSINCPPIGKDKLWDYFVSELV